MTSTAPLPSRGAPVSSARAWATLVVCSLAGFVLACDLTVLHLAIPDLSRSLHPSATQILWMADVYGFALAALLVPMGYLGDRIGRRRLLMLGSLGFAGMSVLTAYASSPGMLIAARGLLGVAGATIMPSTLSLVRNVFTDPKQRTMAVGISGGVTSLGIGAGPLLGGVVLDHFWWGAVFLFSALVMGAVCLVGRFVLPESRDPNPGRFDLVSVPLAIVGVAGIVYAITESPRDGVSAPTIWGPALVGVVVLALFVRRQRRLADPMIDVRLFRARAFTGSVTANLIAMFALVAQSLIFAQYFQQVLGWSPLTAGLASLPGAGAAMVGGGIAGPLIGVWGRARTVGLGMAVAAVGFCLYALVGTSANYAVMVVAMIPVGMGMGFTFAVTMDTVLASVPADRAGAASAVSETANELGGALGMAVLGTVLNTVYRSDLRIPAGTPDQAAQAARESLGGAVQTAAAVPAHWATELGDTARHAFVGGMHAAAFASAGLAALAAVVALITLRGVPKVLHGAGDAVDLAVATTLDPGHGTTAAHRSQPVEPEVDGSVMPS